MSNPMDFTGGKGLEDFMPEVNGAVKDAPESDYVVNTAGDTQSNQAKERLEHEINSSTEFGIAIKNMIVENHISLPAAGAALVANLSLILKFLCHVGEKEVAQNLVTKTAAVLQGVIDNG